MKYVSFCNITSHEQRNKLLYNSVLHELYIMGFNDISTSHKCCHQFYQIASLCAFR